MAADGTLVLVVHFVSELICLLLSTETRKHGSVFPIACKATQRTNEGIPWSPALICHFCAGTAGGICGRHHLRVP